MLYTYLFDHDQLERCLDLRSQSVLRIVHILCEHGPIWDQYVVLVDCDPHQALLLYLL